MKIGLSRPYEDPGFPVNDVDMGIVGKIAEDCGFQWLTYGHHTVRPLDEPVKPPHFGVPLYQDPLIGATRALALTKELEVSTGVLIMPMQHPVQVAKQAGCIDLYSDGRFALGLGTGGASQLEIEASGGSFSKRWAYTMECIQIMKGLWTQDRFEFKGQFFDIPPVLMAPRPSRKSGTPVWLGGFSDGVMKRIGEHCDGWVPAYQGLKLLPMYDQSLSGPEHVVHQRAIIEQHAENSGRSKQKFDINVILGPGSEPDCIKHYEDAEVDRIAFTLPEIASETEARAAIEELASQVF
jgi:probable F420-dependent oxidoreductase